MDPVITTVFETSKSIQSPSTLDVVYLGQGIGLTLFLGGAAVYGLLSFFHRIHWAWRIAVGFLAVLGAFIYTQSPIDELMVNLEHPYNLFHFSQFSFSPDKMVGGTVEVIFYLLHLPFAGTVKGLLIGNQMIGFFVLSLTLGLLLLFAIRRSGRRHVELAAFFFVLSNLSLIEISSEGFGNILVGCFVAGAIVAYDRQKKTLFWVIVTLLPLVRPDAVVASVALAAWPFLEGNRKTAICLVVGSFGALGLYVSFYKLFYGFWIPIPVQFKSFKFSMADMLKVSDYTALLKSVFSPINAWMTICVMAAAFSYSMRPFRPLFVVCGLCFVAMMVLSPINFNPYYTNRYHIQFFILLSFCFILAFIWLDQKISMGIPHLVRVFWVGVAALIFGLTLWSDISTKSWHRYRQFRRIASFEAAGRYLPSLIPKNWTVAATELNTFGLMNDLEILDLWGYTNPYIARSSVCSLRRIRVAPDNIQILEPDIIWFRSWGATGYQPEGKPLGEILAAQRSPLYANFGPLYYQAGDPEVFLAHYHPVILLSADLNSYLFVRREKYDELRRALESQGYSFKRNVSYDLDKIRSEFKMSLKLKDCG